MAMVLANGPPGTGGFSALGLSPEEIVAEQELWTLVRKIVTKLPNPDRTVVEGYFFGERCLKDVGAMAGRSESWASRLLARGMGKVRKELQRRGVPLVFRT
jgi:DNA-directed RNA polymerase specialized sigma subunit